MTTSTTKTRPRLRQRRPTIAAASLSPLWITVILSLAIASFASASVVAVVPDLASEEESLLPSTLSSSSRNRHLQQREPSVLFTFDYAIRFTYTSSASLSSSTVSLQDRGTWLTEAFNWLAADAFRTVDLQQNQRTPFRRVLGEDPFGKKMEAPALLQGQGQSQSHHRQLQYKTSELEEIIRMGSSSLVSSSSTTTSTSISRQQAPPDDDMMGTPRVAFPTLLLSLEALTECFECWRAQHQIEVLSITDNSFLEALEETIQRNLERGWFLFWLQGRSLPQGIVAELIPLPATPSPTANPSDEAIPLPETPSPTPNPSASPTLATTTEVPTLLPSAAPTLGNTTVPPSVPTLAPPEQPSQTTTMPPTDRPTITATTTTVSSTVVPTTSTLEPTINETIDVLEDGDSIEEGPVGLEVYAIFLIGIAGSCACICVYLSCFHDSGRKSSYDETTRKETSSPVPAGIYEEHHNGESHEIDRSFAGTVGDVEAPPPPLPSPEPATRASSHIRRALDALPDMAGPFSAPKQDEHQKYVPMTSKPQWQDTGNFLQDNDDYEIPSEADKRITAEDPEDLPYSSIRSFPKPEEEQSQRIDDEDDADNIISSPIRQSNPRLSWKNSRLSGSSSTSSPGSSQIRRQSSALQIDATGTVRLVSMESTGTNSSMEIYEDSSAGGLSSPTTSKYSAILHRVPSNVQQNQQELDLEAESTHRRRASQISDFEGPPQVDPEPPSRRSILKAGSDASLPLIEPQDANVTSVPPAPANGVDPETQEYWKELIGTKDSPNDQNMVAASSNPSSTSAEEKKESNSSLLKLSEVNANAHSNKPKSGYDYYLKEVVQENDDDDDDDDDDEDLIMPRQPVVTREQRNSSKSSSEQLSIDTMAATEPETYDYLNDLVSPLSNDHSLDVSFEANGQSQSTSSTGLSQSSSATSSLNHLSQEGSSDKTDMPNDEEQGTKQASSPNSIPDLPSRSDSRHLEEGLETDDARAHSSSWSSDFEAGMVETAQQHSEEAYYGGVYYGESDGEEDESRASSSARLLRQTKPAEIYNRLDHVTTTAAATTTAYGGVYYGSDSEEEDYLPRPPSALTIQSDHSADSSFHSRSSVFSSPDAEREWQRRLREDLLHPVHEDESETLTVNQSMTSQN